MTFSKSQVYDLFFLILTVDILQKLYDAALFLLNKHQFSNSHLCENSKMIPDIITGMLDTWNEIIEDGLNSETIQAHLSNIPVNILTKWFQW